MPLNIKKSLFEKVRMEDCHNNIQKCNFTVGFEQNKRGFFYPRKAKNKNLHNCTNGHKPT